MTAQLDITTPELAIVQEILQSILPHDTRVWVFGSRANGHTRHNSDLDIAIQAPSALAHSTTRQLSRAFDESHLPYTVDVVDMRQVAPYFKDIIDAQKIPLPICDNKPALRFADVAKKNQQ